MFDFFRSFRDAERAALAPLVDAALALAPEEVPSFLDELRCDAPTVAARLEDLLARIPAPTPEPTERAPAAVDSPTTGVPARLLPLGARATLAATAADAGTGRAAAA